MQESIAVDLALTTYDDQLLTDLQLSIVKRAKHHDANTFYRLRSIPGVGKILALVLLYAIHDLHRFPRVQDFVSYCPWSNVRRNPLVNAWAPRAKRSAMPTSHGLFPKRLRCSCATTPQGKNAWLA